jgi:hypothetical protein
VAGDAAQAAGLLAHGVCPPGGLAVLPLALTPENSHLAGQRVPFPLVACSSSLLGGFFALQEGLAAFDGLPAPGHLGPGPGQGFAGACLPGWHRHAECPRQVIESGLTLVGVPFPLIGQGIALVSGLLPLVSGLLALVSGLLALVSGPFPLIRQGVALVGVPAELAGQRVPFPLVACSSSLLGGFFALQEGLAAFDGLPAPGPVGLGPGQGFAGACLPGWHRHAECLRQVIESGDPLPGVPFPLVSVPFPLVSVPVPLVSDLLTLVSDSLTLIGVPLAPVGPLVLRGAGTAVRAGLSELHPSRMRWSRWPGRGLDLDRPAGYAASSG